MNRKLTKLFTVSAVLLGLSGVAEVNAAELPLLDSGVPKLERVVPNKKWIGSYYVGKIIPNSWYPTPEGLVYVDESGEKVTEDFIGDTYLDKKGQIVFNKVFEHAGDLFKADSNGNIIKNEWVDGYYYSGNGAMLKSSWVTDTHGKEVYLNGLGRIAKNTWIGSNYVKETGYIAQDEWLNIEGEDFLFNSEGEKVINQKVAQNGKEYYLGNSGRKVTNSVTQIGATVYTTNEAGEIVDETTAGKGYSLIGGLVSPIVVTSQRTGFTSDNILMRYTPIPKYYAAERKSPVGQKVYELSVGDTLTIDGVHYKVSERKTGLTYHDWRRFLDFMNSSYYDLGLQTCDNTDPYIVICKLIKL